MTQQNAHNQPSGLDNPHALAALKQHVEDCPKCDQADTLLRTRRALALLARQRVDDARELVEKLREFGRPEGEEPAKLERVEKWARERCAALGIEFDSVERDGDRVTVTTKLPDVEQFNYTSRLDFDVDEGDVGDLAVSARAPSGDVAAKLDAWALRRCRQRGLLRTPREQQAVALDAKLDDMAKLAGELTESGLRQLLGNAAELGGAIERSHFGVRDTPCVIGNADQLRDTIAALPDGAPVIVSSALVTDASVIVEHARELLEHLVASGACELCGCDGEGDVLVNGEHWFGTVCGNLALAVARAEGGR